MRFNCSIEVLQVGVSGNSSAPLRLPYCASAASVELELLVRTDSWPGSIHEQICQEMAV